MFSGKYDDSATSAEEQDSAEQEQLFAEESSSQTKGSSSLSPKQYTDRVILAGDSYVSDENDLNQLPDPSVYSMQSAFDERNRVPRKGSNRGHIRQNSEVPHRRDRTGKPTRSSHLISAQCHMKASVGLSNSGVSGSISVSQRDAEPELIYYHLSLKGFPQQPTVSIRFIPRIIFQTVMKCFCFNDFFLICCGNIDLFVFRTATTLTVWCTSTIL